MGLRLGATLLVLLLGATAAPAQAQAQAQSSVTITAPSKVAPGKRFAVTTTIAVPDPGSVFVTGGFMDFVKTQPAPSRSRCPRTPAGTYAADTPQSRQGPGVLRSTARARNVTKRTGVVRFCLWVIDASTGEQTASGAAYIKEIAPRKRPPHRGRVAARAAGLSGAYAGHTSQARHPIALRIAGGQVRDLSYTAEFHCSDGLTVLWATRLAAFPIAADGTFHASPAPFGTQNDSASIQGRVKGGHATGSLHETYTSVLGNTCRTRNVRFSASRPKRRH